MRSERQSSVGQYIWLLGIRIGEPCHQTRPRETLQIAVPNEVKGYGGRFHWPIHLSSPTGRGRLEFVIVKQNELGRLKVIKQQIPALDTRNSSVWYSGVDTVIRLGTDYCLGT